MDAAAALSELLGRPVKLERAAPEDFTIDQYHPDIEDLDPEGHRDTVTESKLGSAFFVEAGLPIGGARREHFSISSPCPS